MLAVACVTVWLSSCSYFYTEPGIGKPIDWQELPGWRDDDLVGARRAIGAQCPRMERRASEWRTLCAAVEALSTTDSAQIRRFFEQYFEPRPVHGARGRREGLITGYYEPILRGSLQRSEQYAHPVYGQPDDMLVIDLSSVYPKLEGMRLRGRLVDGNRVVPYWPRAAIDGGQKPLQGSEILWLDDPYDSFFVQIQGSGRVQLDDGRTVGIGYANQNGHPYVAVGRKLVEMGAMPVEQVSLFTIREWLDENPQSAAELLNANPSYVFFELREKVDEGPRGSLNVPLTAQRSMAVDRRVIPLGTPVWLQTSLPDGSSYRRLMIAQDTGGAIAGPVRADVFFGVGAEAEQLAGHMRQQGRLYALLPKQR